MEDTVRRKHSREFKLQIIRMVKDDQRKVSQVSEETGIDSALIYKWIRIFEKNPEEYLPGEGKPSERDEIKRLKKKIAILAEENEILKKAMAIFSKQQKPSTR